MTRQTRSEPTASQTSSKRISWPCSLRFMPGEGMIGAPRSRPTLAGAFRRRIRSLAQNLEKPLAKRSAIRHHSQAFVRGWRSPEALRWRGSLRPSAPQGRDPRRTARKRIYSRIGENTTRTRAAFYVVKSGPNAYAPNPRNAFSRVPQAPAFGYPGNDELQPLVAPKKNPQRRVVKFEDSLLNNEGEEQANPCNCQDDSPVASLQRS